MKTKNRNLHTVIGIQDHYTDKLCRIDFGNRNYYNLRSKYGAEARKALRERCGFSPEMADKSVRDADDIFNIAHPELFDSMNRA